MKATVFGGSGFLGSHVADSLTKNGYDQITMINSKELDELEKQLALYKFKLEMEKGERSILEEGTISSKDVKKELGI